MNERRTQPRRTTADYFLLYEVGPNTLIGRIMDLTTEGAMIMCDSKVATNVSVPCRLALPRMVGMLRNIFFEATIVWCRKHDKWDWYEAGLAIQNISSDQMEVLEQIVADWKVKQGADNPAAF